MNCLFCKIVNGEIPASIIYEDELAIAFMDIGPIVEGHALVIPKEHVDPLTEASDELLAHLISVCKKVAIAQQTAFQSEGWNLIQNNGAAAGQEVPHLHFHVIPRFSDDGHQWNWDAKSYDSMATLSDKATQLKTALTHR